MSWMPAAAGPGEARLLDLMWVMLAMAGAVSLIVLTLLVLALRRSKARRGAGARTEERGDRRAERGFIIGGGIVMSTIVLAVLVVLAARVGDTVYAPAGREFEVPETDPAAARAAAEQGAEEPLRVEVVGHQFWWEARYPDHGIVTANELHIPVGRLVRFELSSADVIHSFWLPRLGPKADMIPGKANVLHLRADRTGEFRGECTEFCGTQHALMQFIVVAQEPEAFEAWAQGRAQPAAEPASASAQRGQQVFEESTCAACHTIQGTEADGDLGPDLTHLASRRTLAAGILPNTRGHLGGWIVDPQAAKPGNLMPPSRLEPDELTDLLDYLEGLE